MSRHIRKGDDVMIRTGDFRGRTGTVVRIMAKVNRVVVKGPQIEGITKNLKATRVSPQGGQVTVDRSFHISNVSPLVDGKATRVRFPTRADGSKVRVAVLGGKELKELGTVRSAKRASTSKSGKPSGKPAAVASAAVKTPRTTKKKAASKA